MEYITQEELERRIEDVCRNALMLTAEGKVGLRPISPEGEYWMTMWTHILEEASLRDIGLPKKDNFSLDTFPKATWPKAPRAATAIDGKKLSEGSFLVKYGQKKYLNRMYNEGQIRISPASFYKNPSLNTAINDDESVLSVALHPDKATISHINNKTGKESRILPVGNITTTFSLITNYYVYCMAHVYDFRLFDDFEADACIIIHDVKAFLSRLDKVFKSAEGNWSFMTNQVRYVDPLNPPREQDIDVFFCKHFRYSYQKEVRAVWIPEEDRDHLEPVHLDIGAMGAYAEYVEI